MWYSKLKLGSRILKESIVDVVNGNSSAGWKAELSPRFSNYTVAQFKEFDAIKEKESSQMAINKSKPKKPSKLSVYLYIPNIIGYVRVLMNVYAFAICFSNKPFFCILYFISFVCDGIDGWAARKFNQVSTFGAVLDMITDFTATGAAPSVFIPLLRSGLTFVSFMTATRKKGLNDAVHGFHKAETKFSPSTKVPAL